MPGLPLRRRAVVTAVCLIVVLAATITVEVDHRSGSSPAGISSAPAGPVPAHPSAVILPLLDQRATALRDGDLAGWLAPLDTAQDVATQGFRSAQRQVFDRVRTLRPVTWSYQVAGGTTLAAGREKALGASAWLADVQLDYQLAAHSPQVRRQQFLTIVRRAGGWRIAADTDGPTGRDVWDLSPVTHASADRCEVVGTQARRALVVELANECGAAAHTVDVAWGTGWTRQTVLTIPGSLGQLAILLGRTGSGVDAGGATDADPTAGLERTAAVTIGPAGAAADEVLINGAAFDDLRPIGRRVVLTHELVHVATRATGARSAPTWLEEGFADYVAYRDTGLPADQVAGEALAAVRAGHLPGTLPRTGDFDAAGDKAAAAYGQAWVAVQLIAAKAGTRARMKSFYQRAAVGAGAVAGQRAGADAAVDGALRWVGLNGIAGLTALWRARLRELAGAR